MKRSELYARVWAEPMIRVAADLGLSGPGLAKLCARSGIPTPARGHWAKLQAGKRSRQPPLPQAELDPNIPLPTPAQRERKKRQKTFDEGVRTGVSARGDMEVAHAGADPGQTSAESTKADPIGASTLAVTIADTLDRPHPLVRATAVAVARLPALLKRWERATRMQRASASLPHRPILRNGRYELDVPGGLALVASLEAMDWILRFVDALLKGLRGQGVRIERTTRKDERVAVLRLAKDGEELVMAPVVEGYKCEAVDAQELARLKEEGGWANKWRYWPSGRMSISVQGTERIVNASWSGTPDRLEAQLGTMIATCVELMAQQPTHRKEREIEEERRRQEEERQYNLRRQREAREEQLKKAFEASEQYEQERRLRRFLAVVERQAGQFVEPYPERAKVWLQVVRAQLEAQSPWRHTLGECLTGPSWQPWPPRWWPSSDATEDN